MATAADFTTELEAKVAQQLKSQRVGYLLGAGSSYLNGSGYPLASELWDLIKDEITDVAKRDAIQAKLDGGASGIEDALDLLDDGGANDTPYRLLVTEALAALFMPKNPPLDLHRAFVRRLALRGGPCAKVFSLNYDPLIERAAERERVRVVDGFLGHEHAFFNAAVFTETILVNHGPRARPTLQPAGVPVHLYKLHGSLGWYESATDGVCRRGFSQPQPAGTARLMVPPQRRKASDVVKAPYSPIWTEFRGAMSQDAKPLHRLVAIGYGFGDNHVNDVIEAALHRDDFTLLIFTLALNDTAWNRWSARSNTIVVTRDRCANKGQIGPGHADLWNFERLAKEV